MTEDTSKFSAQDYSSKFPEMVRNLDQIRLGTGTKSKKPLDISFEDLTKEQWGLSLEDVLTKVGVDTKITSMENIFTMPDQSIKWIVPEIIRSAVVLGLRQAPFYPDLISADEPVSQLKVTMPYINMSNAVPTKLNEAETISVGNISYGSKTVNLFKIGKGMKITDEVKNYVSLDVMSIFLRDLGVQMGYVADTLAIDTLINGNQSDGSESAPVIGVTDTAKLTQYRDLLRVWIRGSRMGRSFTNLVGSEETALDLLDLPEFKNKQQGTTQSTLNVKTPVPNSANFYIHPGIPASMTLLLDRSSAMIKLTSQQLKLESERIVSNQTEAIYATMTTGFSKMFRDASILVDQTKLFSANGFPDYMNIDPYLNINLG